MNFRKFNIKTFVILSLFTALLLPVPVFANSSCSGVETSIIECEGGGDAGIWHILLLAIDIMSIGIGILGLIGILIFGIQYLTGGGDVNKTTKAKHRLYEIVIGLVAWVVLYSFCEWLMPGGKFGFNSDITEIKLSFSQSTLETGKTIQTTVDFTPSDTKDKTYSLSTDNSDIASVVGKNITCRKEGTTTITATSVNGKKSSADITCTKPPETANNGGNGGNGGNGNTATPSSDYFECDNCPYPTGLASSTSFYSALGTENGSITYEAARQLATSKGISDENFYNIVAWTRTENHENTGNGYYFAYLCASTMVNKAIKGENLTTQMRNWANASPSKVWFYAYSQFLGSNDSSHCQKDNIYGTGQTVCGYYPSNLKIAYMALKYTYPNVTFCNGVDIPSNILVYQNGTYIGW